MKLSPTICAVLLSSAAVAAPLTEQRRAHKETRVLSSDRHGNPPFVPDTRDILQTNKSVHAQYSSNWAGAVLVGTGYTAVTGQFTVPVPSVPAGGSSQKKYCASAWVGIDGDSCTSGILQTGIDFCIQSGSTSYHAWYEWYPDYAYDFTGISFSAGDTVKVTVIATSTVTGNATVENTSTGKKVTHTFNGDVLGMLCETNAEWIVEDYQSGSSLVPFANFGTVTFAGAQATTGETTVGPASASLMDIKQNGHVLTNSSVTSDSVTVKYI
ncbi:hypothetical protein BBP40_005802 [Aspergillus hancockii]|nr:hypothetical protein BBP40_005802 [Aspergillus hancockii]